MEVPKIEVIRTLMPDFSYPLLVMSVFGGKEWLEPNFWLTHLSGGVDPFALAGKKFSAKVGETLVITPPKGPRRILLVGAGEREKATIETMRRVGGCAGSYAKEQKISSVILYESGPLAGDMAWVAACIEGVALALYSYEHKNPKQPEEINIGVSLNACDEGEDERELMIRKVTALVRAKYLARDLGNTPANLMTPTIFGGKAKNLADSLGFDYKLLCLSGLREMGLLLAVSKGSGEEPRFFHAWYTPEREAGDVDFPPKVVLIGKGLTFDAGGTSLKPGLKMDEMKYDMCGGAAVTASMITVAEMKPNCEVHFVVLMTENLPDGKALKPGDVITAMDGQTVEVLNTDAEGRLILADAFCYVKEHIKPDGPNDMVLDFATLTGAIIVALGHYVTGFFTNSDDLAEIIAQETDTGEAVCRMPLVEEMEDELKSDFADMANIGNSQTGGSIMGVLFLKKFIGKWRWAHFDTAGTSWRKGKSALSYQPLGATGVMVGTIAAILKRNFTA